MEKIKKYFVIALVTLGLFFFVGTSIKMCSDNRKIDKLEQKVSMADASRDSISKVYNKQLKAWDYSRSLYVAENFVLKSELGKYSKELDSLKKAKPKADVGFIVKTETKTETKWKTDTVMVDSAKRPVYQYSYKDEFTEGDATAYPDSLKLKLITKTALIGTIENGRFTVTPTNNNVAITGLEGFQVKQPKVKSKFWKGLGIGVGIGAIATGAIILSK